MTMLNVSGQTVLIVGSGPVGRRKLRTVLEAGAVVRVVSLEGAAVPTGVEWVVEPYRESHLDCVKLVFAAATPEVNRRVVADCQARGLWVSSASDPESGTFTLPAVRTIGDVTFAVSTHGAAPAFAAALCEEIVKPFDDRLAAFVDELRRLREELKQSLESDQERQAILRLRSTWAAFREFAAD